VSATTQDRPTALRILLLEDDPVDVQLVRDMLRALGVAASVHAAASRAEFLQALREGSFDIVLSDYHVPGWDGMQALRETRARHPDLPFILVTGTIGEESAVEALKRGATDLVLKHQLARLVPVVHRALAESSQRAALQRAQDAVRSSEERFRALVENSADAILMVDATGTVLYASPSTARITGYAPDERVGRLTFDLVHADDLPQVQAMLAQSQASPGSVLRSELRIRHKDGRWVDVECAAANHLHNPAIGAIVVNYRDVSERRRLEDMLRQSQKMEAVGRVAGGIAHDFNNVLGVTLGYSDLILRRMDARDPLRPKVMEIRKAAERAGALTRQLMSFSRKRAPLAEKLELGAVVRDLAEMVQRVLGEDVELVLRLDPDAGEVRADRTQVDQVLMNLAVNARDAMPRGGKLIVEVRNVELERPTQLQRLAAAGSYVLLSVTDTGVGMEPEVQQHLFEPFFTTKPPGQGTGLGLATVYGIVSQYSGHITVYSELRRGTSFKIYLPAVPERRDRAPAPLPPAAPGGKETVLLVEDAEALRGLTREVLEAAGYTVLEAANGEEALRVSGACQTRIHLLLTDLVMPDMSGRELAGWLRVADSTLKAVFMSGYTDQAAMQRGELADGAHFVQKPFSGDALLRALRAALDAGPAEPAPPQRRG
jgi:two-component system, cell cycle sensor histidine kinase and response regulator CckA